MKDPQTSEEWQEAVDHAYVCLLIVSAREYGLITGGPEVNEARCEEILAKGRERGVFQSPGCVERVLQHRETE